MRSSSSPQHLGLAAPSRSSFIRTRSPCSAGIKRTAAAYITKLAERGRYHFTTEDAVAALGGSLLAARAALRRLKAKGEVADPFGGFHVIVPPEYRRLGCLRPEHLAAMKVLAMKNDPLKTFRELADLQFLPGVDREEIRGYFVKHGLVERFDELERAMAAAEPR